MIATASVSGPRYQAIHDHRAFEVDARRIDRDVLGACSPPTSAERRAVHVLDPGPEHPRDESSRARRATAATFASAGHGSRAQRRTTERGQTATTIAATTADAADGEDELASRRAQRSCEVAAAVAGQVDEPERDARNESGDERADRAGSVRAAARSAAARSHATAKHDGHPDEEHDRVDPHRLERAEEQAGARARRATAAARAA